MDGWHERIAITRPSEHWIHIWRIEAWNRRDERHLAIEGPDGGWLADECVVDDEVFDQICTTPLRLNGLLEGFVEKLLAGQAMRLTLIRASYSAGVRDDPQRAFVSRIAIETS